MRCRGSNCERIPPPRLWLTLIRKAANVIKKKILSPDRIRRISGGFSFVPHRFLCEGFLASLQQKELLLYLFLVLAADRHGLSFYSYDAICSLLQLDYDPYISARNALIDNDLIDFDGTVFQVLELPAKPVLSVAAKPTDLKRTKGQEAIARLVDQTLKRV